MYARPRAPRCFAHSCHASSWRRGWLGAAGHHDRADVRRLEHAERRVGEELRHVGDLEVEAQVRLVRAVLGHRLVVGDARDRPRDLVPDQLPQRGDDLLAELDDVVLLDEAHLDVELGELRLAVGAEVFVPVAARDLVVPLHAADHEQLLEQLRRLRQGVPGAGLEPGRDQEVAGAFRGGAGHRRRLDLDEVLVVQHLAGGAADLAAQPHGRGRAAAAQVQVAVLEADLLADVDPVVDRERQRRGLGQHLELGREDLDLTGRDLGVRVALGALRDLADDLDAELRAQRVGALGHLALAEDDLGDAARVAEVDEDDAAVISPPGHPSGEGDGLSGLLGTQGAGVVSAEHCDCSPSTWAVLAAWKG